jgi:cinnamyl-alcohol dehydrogenase
MIIRIARHEIAGIVKEIGSNVQRFKVGDHVGVGTFVNSCRDCEYCDEALEIHCLKRAVGTFNAIDVDGTITKGGYSNSIVVHERQDFYDVTVVKWMRKFLQMPEMI